MKCEIAFWDTVGDTRFYQNIFSCIFRSNVIVAMYYLTINKDKKQQKKMNESIQFLINLDRKLKPYFKEQIDCILVAMTLDDSITYEQDQEDDSKQDVDDIKYNEEELQFEYEKLHFKTLTLLNKATKLFRFVAHDKKFIVHTKILHKQRPLPLSSVSQNTVVHPQQQQKCLRGIKCCFNYCCYSWSCCCSSKNTITTSKTEKDLSAEVQRSNQQEEQGTDIADIKIVGNSEEKIYDQDDEKNAIGHAAHPMALNQRKRALSVKEKILTHTDDLYFRLSDFDNVLIEISNYCENYRNLKVSKDRYREQMKWWNGFLVRKTHNYGNVNNNYNDDDKPRISKTISNLAIYWGLRRTETIRPWSSMTRILKMFGIFILCLICIVFSPMLSLLQTVIFWLYSDSNQMFSNRFVTLIIHTIDIEISHKILYYDFLYVLFKSNHPDPRLRHEMSNIIRKHSFHLDENDESVENNHAHCHEAKKTTNLSHLYITRTKFKLMRSVFSLTMIVLYTMSAVNLTFWWYNINSDEEEETSQLSSYELITGPIWLFLIGIVLSSWYCYGVRIEPSMDTINSATASETLEFTYIDTSTSNYKIITSNIAAFSSNCHFYDTTKPQKVELKSYLKRRNIRHGFFVGVVLAFEPIIVRSIYYLFGITAELHQQSLMSYIIPPNTGMIVFNAGVINFLFIFVAQYVFFKCIHSKVDIYKRLIERITEIIELPLKNPPNLKTYRSVKRDNSNDAFNQLQSSQKFMQYSPKPPKEPKPPAVPPRPPSRPFGSPSLSASRKKSYGSAIKSPPPFSSINSYSNNSDNDSNNYSSPRSPSFGGHRFSFNSDNDDENDHEHEYQKKLKHIKKKRSKNLSFLSDMNNSYAARKRQALSVTPSGYDPYIRQEPVSNTFQKHKLNRIIKRNNTSKSNNSKNSANNDNKDNNVNRNEIKNYYMNDKPKTRPARKLPLSKEVGFEFLSLETPNNLVAWSEMREYAYLNGMKIFGDLELLVLMIGIIVVFIAVYMIHDTLFETRDGIILYGETRIARLLIWILVISWILEIMFVGFEFDYLQQRQIEAINIQLQCILLNYQNETNLTGFGQWITIPSISCWKTLKNMINYPEKHFDVNNKDFKANYAAFNVEKRKFNQHIQTLHFFLDEIEKKPLNPMIFGYSLTGALLKTLMFSVVAPIFVFISRNLFEEDL